MIEKRSVVSVILLSIITCGIYMVWWTYVTCCALQREGGKTSIPPVATTLLMLFTGVGGVLLGIDADDNVNAIKFNRGIPQTDNKVLWIVLGLFLPIATVGLVQHEINQIIDRSQGGYPPFGNYPPNGNYPPYGNYYQQNGGNYPPNGGNYPPNGEPPRS